MSEIIEVAPFSKDNAERVVKWRNAPAILENSLNSSEIKLEQHMKFLSHLSECRDKGYFILSLKGDEVAVFNVNFLSSDDAYWGCYLVPNQFPKPGCFPLLILLAGRVSFEVLQCNRLKSDVLVNNRTPQSMNEFLGLKSIKSPEDPGVLQYEINAADWDTIQKKLAKVLTKDLYRAALDMELGTFKKQYGK